MNLRLAISACILALSASATLHAKESVSSLVPAREITLNFPSESCYGQISELKANRTKADDNSKEHLGKSDPQESKLISAQGKTKISVRPGYLISFEPNKRMYEHPEVMLKINPENIEALRIKFSGMDSNEEKYCDRLLKYVGHFNHLKYLRAKMSDLSDSGFKSIGPLPELLSLDLSNTLISARSIPEIAHFKTINSLGISNVNISGANLALLGQIPELETLFIHAACISDKEFAGLGKCTSLLRIEISRNARLTNSCIASLKPLKHLRYINISQTAINPRALLILKGLPIRKIVLDDHTASEATIQELKQCFPKLNIKESGFENADGVARNKPVSPRPISKDDSILFAPLK